jgi:hypothetical protein
VFSPPTAAGMQGTALGRGALYLDEPAHNLGCVAVRVSHYALATVLARRRRDRETRAERARRRTQSDERSDVATTRRGATFDAWLRDSRRRWLQASRSKTTRRSERVVRSRARYSVCEAASAKGVVAQRARLTVASPRVGRRPAAATDDSLARLRRASGRLTRRPSQNVVAMCHDARLRHLRSTCARLARAPRARGLRHASGSAGNCSVRFATFSSRAPPHPTLAAVSGAICLRPPFHV